MAPAAEHPIAAPACLSAPPVCADARLFLVFTLEEAAALAQLPGADPAAQRGLAKLRTAVESAAAATARQAFITTGAIATPIDDDYVPWRDEADGIYR